MGTIPDNYFLAAELLADSSDSPRVENSCQELCLGNCLFNFYVNFETQKR
mgnify:CR=1 FL=1